MKAKTGLGGRLAGDSPVPGAGLLVRPVPELCRLEGAGGFYAGG